MKLLKSNTVVHVFGDTDSLVCYVEIYDLKTSKISRHYIGVV